MGRGTGVDRDDRTVPREGNPGARVEHRDRHAVTRQDLDLRNLERVLEMLIGDGESRPGRKGEHVLAGMKGEHRGVTLLLPSLTRAMSS